MICRALLVYCVKHYKGDEKIKSFIWELITPTKDGQAQTLQNHSGESGRATPEKHGLSCTSIHHLSPCVGPCWGCGGGFSSSDTFQNVTCGKG